MFTLLLFILVSCTIFLAGVILPFLVNWLHSRRRRSEVLLPPVPVGASIEVIIPAYLEAGTIDASVSAIKRQLRKWQGPASVTVIASDDETALASGAADKVMNVGRQGKPEACNVGISASIADIVVLTDANCHITPDDWPERVKNHLSSWSVVSANKREIDGRDGIFWRLESMIKNGAATNIGSLAVVGEFMAFRRLDFRPVPKSKQLDDFWIALDFHRRNLGVAVASDISTVEPASNPSDQWERRVRISAGVFYEALPNIQQLFRSATGRLYIAHKLYRTTIGVAGFWAAMIGFSLLWPIVTIPLSISMVALAVASYSGRISMRTPLGPVLTVIALQAVPLVGAIRALHRRLRESRGRESVGWKKIAR